MALTDLIPESLRAPKAVGGKSATPHAPRVSGVSDEALTPVPDAIAGTVLPYRGTELHGVPATPPYQDTRTNAKDVDAVHLVELHPPTPVLVKVVESDGTEVRDWRTISTVADSVPRVLVNRLDTRQVARVYNNGAETVWIGRDSTVSALNGYPIPAASFLKIEHTTEVWGVSTTGASCDVRALVEYVRG